MSVSRILQDKNSQLSYEPVLKTMHSGYQFNGGHDFTIFIQLRFKLFNGVNLFIVELFLPYQTLTGYYYLW